MTQPIPVLAKVEELIDEAEEALKAMFAACDEWAAEFTLHKHAANWGVINDSYLKAQRVLDKIRRLRDK